MKKFCGAKKIEKFIDLTYEQKKAMGFAARAKVEKEFDRKIVVEKYLNELDVFGDRYE